MSLFFFIFSHTRIYFTKQLAGWQGGRFYPSEGRIIEGRIESAYSLKRPRNHRLTLPQP